MTDQRGLPFMDAVKELAQAAGMEVPALDRRAAETAERAKGLHDVDGGRRDWFAEQLRRHRRRRGARGAREARRHGRRPRARSASASRPIRAASCKAALEAYGDAMLVEAGLLIAVEDKEPYDRFRGRLMIPIRDPRGRVDRVRRAHPRRRRAEISQLARHPALRQGPHALQSRSRRARRAQGRPGDRGRRLYGRDRAGRRRGSTRRSRRSAPR